MCCCGQTGIGFLLVINLMKKRKNVKQGKHTFLTSKFGMENNSLQIKRINSSFDASINHSNEPLSS
jgi:hypothetical protein